MLPTVHTLPSLSRFLSVSLGLFSPLFMSFPPYRPLPATPSSILPSTPKPDYLSPAFYLYHFHSVATWWWMSCLQHKPKRHNFLSPISLFIFLLFFKRRIPHGMLSTRKTVIIILYAPTEWEIFIWKIVPPFLRRWTAHYSPFSVYADVNTIIINNHFHWTNTRLLIAQTHPDWGSGLSCGNSDDFNDRDRDMVWHPSTEPEHRMELKGIPPKQTHKKRLTDHFVTGRLYRITLDDLRTHRRPTITMYSHRL